MTKDSIKKPPKFNSSPLKNDRAGRGKRASFWGARVHFQGFFTREVKKLPRSIYADNEATVIPRSWVMSWWCSKKSLAKDVLVFYLAKMFVSMWKKCLEQPFTWILSWEKQGQFFGPEVDQHFNQKEPLHFTVNLTATQVVITFFKGICRDFAKDL